MDTLRAGNTKQIGKWDLSRWKISSINENNKSLEGMLEKYLTKKKKKKFCLKAKKHRDKLRTTKM